MTTIISHSQTLRPLSIGDKVPNMIIGYDISKPFEKTRLYDLKAPLILLDFFSTGCSACITGFKKLDSLQSQFKNIKIISITNESSEQLKSVFAKHKWKYPALPVLTATKDFAKLFPYVSVPHHVWLDSNFRVRHITIAANANEKNITAFLSGKNRSLATKYELQDFDEAQPLWLEGNGRWFDRLEYYSFITKNINGLPAPALHRFTDKKNNTVGFKANNQPLFTLIKAAWGYYPDNLFENNNRIALEVEDSSLFIPPSDPNDLEPWLEKNAFCYMLSVPASKKDQVFTIMQQDISRYFNYDIRIEKRKIPCYILVRTSCADKIKSQGLINKTPRFTKDSIILKKATLSGFVKSLNNPLYGWPKPLLDETNYTNRADLYLGCWYDEIGRLKSELHKYDLDIIEEDRMIDILVIRNKKEGSY